MLKGYSAVSGVEVPASAVETKHVLQFREHEYAYEIGWNSLKERLEGLNEAVVDVIYPRVYNSTSRFSARFVVIGKCRIDGAKHNVIEFAGFDECESISIYTNQSDATIYAMSLEKARLRSTLSRTPIRMKGVTLVPERFDTVKGFRSDVTTSLRVTPFARPDGFTKLCSLVSAQAKSYGAPPRHVSIWKKIGKVLTTNIDDEIIWGSYNQGKEQRLVHLIEQLRVLFQDPRRENWSQKVFANLKERVDCLVEENVQVNTA